MRNGIKPRQEFILICLLFLLVNGIMALTQERFTLNDGLGWDGVHYAHMAQQFIDSEPVVAPAPFVRRIGTPFMVANLYKFTHAEVIDLFAAVNLFANFITTLLFWLWLRSYIQSTDIRILLLLMFLVQWHGTVRITYWHPVLTDNWALVFLMSSLLALERLAGIQRAIALSVFSFIGVFFREILIIVPLMLWLINKPLVLAEGRIKIDAFWKRLPPLYNILPFIAALAAWAIISKLVTPDNVYSFVDTALFVAYVKPLPIYLLSWFVAYGTVLVLLIYAISETADFLYTHQHLAFWLLIVAVLGYTGGTDTHRFLYWGFPVIYVLMGRALEKHRAVLSSPLVIAALAFTWILSQRVFWASPAYGGPVMPDIAYPFFSSLARLASYQEIVGQTEFRWLHTTQLAQHLIFCGILLLYLYWRADKPYLRWEWAILYAASLLAIGVSLIGASWKSDLWRPRVADPILRQAARFGNVLTLVGASDIDYEIYHDWHDKGVTAYDPRLREKPPYFYFDWLRDAGDPAALQQWAATLYPGYLKDAGYDYLLIDAVWLARQDASKTGILYDPNHYALVSLHEDPADHEFYRLYRVVSHAYPDVYASERLKVFRQPNGDLHVYAIDVGTGIFLVSITPQTLTERLHMFTAENGWQVQLTRQADNQYHGRVIDAQGNYLVDEFVIKN